MEGWSLNNRQLSILKRVALCFMLTLLTEVIKWTCICRIKYKPFLLPNYNFFVYFDRCWFGSAVIFRLYFLISVIWSVPCILAPVTREWRHRDSVYS